MKRTLMLIILAGFALTVQAKDIPAEGKRVEEKPAIEAVGDNISHGTEKLGEGLKESGDAAIYGLKEGGSWLGDTLKAGGEYLKKASE
jgi:hypothetical protein